MATTSRLSLRYPVASDTADVPRDIGNLASDIDKAAIFAKGTFASRPTSTVGSPGIDGRYYFATDTSRLYLDTGTSWVEVASGNDSVTAAMIAADAVDTSEIKDSAVTSAKIADGTIATADLANGAVTQAKTTGLPYGVLAFAQRTSNFTTSSTHTNYQDVTDLTASVTYGANRRLKISFMATPYGPGGAQNVRFELLRTSTSVRNWLVQGSTLATGTEGGAFLSEVWSTGASGATETFKIRMKADQNNTQVGVACGSDRSSWLLVEDIGPS